MVTYPFAVSARSHSSMFFSGPSGPLRSSGIPTSLSSCKAPLPQRPKAPICQRFRMSVKVATEEQRLSLQDTYCLPEKDRRWVYSKRRHTYNEDLRILPPCLCKTLLQIGLNLFDKKLLVLVRRFARHGLSFVLQLPRPIHDGESSSSVARMMTLSQSAVIPQRESRHTKGSNTSFILLKKFLSRTLSVLRLEWYSSKPPYHVV